VKISTRTGDDGTTSLVGSRVRKNHPRVCACGDLDELSALLGLARAEGGEPGPALLLTSIQRDLLAIGAHLADPEGTRDDAKTSISPARVRELECAIEAAESELPALRAFILPGGSRLGALLHVARAICRRAERSVVALAGEAPVEPLLLSYLNRLSDLLFLLARRANHLAGAGEDIW
jgi:cob(I)alamin adenosyltransferase